MIVVICSAQQPINRLFYGTHAPRWQPKSSRVSRQAHSSWLESFCWMCRRRNQVLATIRVRQGFCAHIAAFLFYLCIQRHTELPSTPSTPIDAVIEDASPAVTLTSKKRRRDIFDHFSDAVNSPTLKRVKVEVDSGVQSTIEPSVDMSPALTDCSDGPAPISHPTHRPRSSTAAKKTHDGGALG